jgi:hypothetical protein
VFRNRPVSLVLVGLFVWVTACTTYTQIEPGEVADHGKVRVTTTDGERETVYDPRVEADSIKGRSRRGKEALAIPLDQVSELEAVGTDEVGTALIVLPLVGLMIFVIVCSAEECIMDMGY